MRSKGLLLKWFMLEPYFNVCGIYICRTKIYSEGQRVYLLSKYHCVLAMYKSNLPSNLVSSKLLSSVCKGRTVVLSVRFDKFLGKMLS